MNNQDTRQETTIFLNSIPFVLYFKYFNIVISCEPPVFLPEQNLSERDKIRCREKKIGDEVQRQTDKYAIYIKRKEENMMIIATTVITMMTSTTETSTVKEQR